MARPHRERAATARKRLRILDATEEIMLQEGYAAVSSRSVAARVGINPPLVHYYFPTLDDLFVAVLRRRGGANVERMVEAFDSDEPLRSWWRLASDPRGTALLVELIAAANHRPALQAAVGEFAREIRRMQMDRLTTLLGQYGLDPGVFPPALVAATVQGLAFALVADEVAGYDTATDEARSAMAGLIDRLEEARACRSTEPDPPLSPS
jgi:AcrR family transcriptional regulator